MSHMAAVPIFQKFVGFFTCANLGNVQNCKNISMVKHTFWKLYWWTVYDCNYTCI